MKAEIMTGAVKDITEEIIKAKEDPKKVSELLPTTQLGVLTILTFALIEVVGQLEGIKESLLRAEDKESQQGG